MKLVRFGPAGREKPGILDSDGKIRDLSKVVPDINGEALASGLGRIKKAKIARLPVVKGKPRLGPCVGGTRHFIAIGLNYADHAAETGSPIPKEPIIFSKAPNCIVGPNDSIMVPKGSTKLDYELELAIVIGRRARYIESEKDALNYVAGYCICNDVSERVFQAERGGQWMKGKGAETFGPVGPWLVTRDEVKDPQNLNMSLTVNGETRQNGSTKTMIFGVQHIVWYCSQFFVLEPGDIITTGTPPGVALGHKPPKWETPGWLKPGDVVKLHIEGLGEQQQRVVAFKK
jgi:2-keto-4-pentenoate hydratase/2-oxohepta-3-ene-1,7-dioic acid hydratase in catechol pathway